MSRTTFQSSSRTTKIAHGMTAGIIAGGIMLAAMTILMSMLGLPIGIYPIMLGAMVSKSDLTALISGLGLHFIVSVTIGAIFGAVTSRIDNLIIDTLVKGITFGVVAGIMAFIVLFIPMLSILLPQNMMNLINMLNPSMSSQTITSIAVIGSLLSHLTFGITLGILITGFELTFAKKHRKQFPINNP